MRLCSKPPRAWPQKTHAGPTTDINYALRTIQSTNANNCYPWILIARCYTCQPCPRADKKRSMVSINGFHGFETDAIAKHLSFSKQRSWKMQSRGPYKVVVVHIRRVPYPFTPVRYGVLIFSSLHYSWSSSAPRARTTPLNRPVPPSSFPSSTGPHRSRVSPQPNCIPQACSRRRFSIGWTH